MTALTSAATVLLWCTDCGGDREFTRPPCAEHPTDCPERACVGCGAAVVLDLAGGDHAARHVAAA